MRASEREWGRDTHSHPIPISFDSRSINRSIDRTTRTTTKTSTCIHLFNNIHTHTLYFFILTHEREKETKKKILKNKQNKKHARLTSFYLIFYYLFFLNGFFSSIIALRFFPLSLSPSIYLIH